MAEKGFSITSPSVRPPKVKAAKVLVLGLTIRGNSGVITNNSGSLTAPRFSLPVSGPVLTGIANTVRNALGIPSSYVLVLGLTVKIEDGKVLGAKVSANMDGVGGLVDCTISGPDFEAWIAEAAHKATPKSK